MTTTSPLHRTLVFALAIAFLVSLVLLGTSGTAGAKKHKVPFKACDNHATELQSLRKVKAKFMKCPAARTVAIAIAKGQDAPQHFECTDKAKGDSLSWTCMKNAKTVKFMADPLPDV